MDPRSVLVAAALALGGLLVVACLVGLFFAQTGPRRAGLVAAVLPLALIVPALAVCYGSFALIAAFRGMADGGDAAAEIIPLCRHVWMTVRGSAAVVAGVALFTLLLTLVPFKERPDAAACSPRRALVLLALPVAALALTVGLASLLRTVVRVSHVVVRPANDDAAKAAAEAVLSSEGLGGLEGAGGIAAVSNHIALRASVGSLGAPAVVLVLLGLSITGALLAAPVRMGGGVVAAACLLWLVVAAAGAAVAAGLGDALRVP